MFMHSAYLGYFHRNTNRDTFITTLKAHSCPLSVIHKQLMKILSNTNLSELANYSDVITKFRMLPAVYKHMVSPQFPQDLKLSYRPLNLKLSYRQGFCEIPRIVLTIVI